MLLQALASVTAATLWRRRYISFVTLLLRTNATVSESRTWCERKTEVRFRDVPSSHSRVRHTVHLPNQQVLQLLCSCFTLKFSNSRGYQVWSRVGLCVCVSAYSASIPGPASPRKRNQMVRSSLRSLYDIRRSSEDSILAPRADALKYTQPSS